MRNIKILGAGLSGLTAGINLAKAGYKVDIYEKNKDVGMRFYGDFQGLENWSGKKDILKELKEINIEINFDYNPFSTVVLTDGSKDKEVNSKKPFFYLVKRGCSLRTIDCGLKKQALKSGVKIYFNKTLLEDKTDIVATGSIFEEVPAVAKGIVFETELKDIAIMACNDKLAFKGYSYFLITKGYGCICTVVFGELNKVDECFEKTKKFFVKKFNVDIQSSKSVGGIGSFSLQNIFKKKNTLYVGEAAGLQDFLWGFGMKHAIKSGYFAAQSIIKNEDYKKTMKNYFGSNLKASVVNRYLWERIISKNNYSIFLNNAEFIVKNLYSIYNYNVLHRIMYPISLSYLKKKYPKLRL